MEGKSTPSIRFPEFNGEWTRRKLSDIGYFYYGKSAPKWSLSEDAKTPCVRYGELYSTFGEVVDKIHSYTNIAPENLKFSKGGEILVPRVGEDPLDFANCSYLPFSDVAIGEMISVFNTTENGLYLTYYINSRLKKGLAKMVEGGSVSNLYFRYLEPLKINIPSLQEQQKIASFLSDVDAKITQLTKKKKLLEQYKKGIMQKIFSQELRFKDDAGNEFPKWSFKKLGKISNITTGSSNRQDSGLDGEFTFFDRSEDIRTSSRYLFDGEAIIVAGEGSDFIPKYFVGKFDLHQRTYAIMNFKDSVSKYLYYYIHFHRNYFLSQAVGSTVKSLRLPMFQKMPIKLPVIEEQLKIANFLSDIDIKIEALNTKIESSKAFKKGLLQKMFI